MLDKIKRYIEKIRTKIFYNRCYDNMESKLIAVFGMCAGKKSPAYRTEYCLSCPYFRDVRGDNNAR